MVLCQQCLGECPSKHGAVASQWPQLLQLTHEQLEVRTVLLGPQPGTRFGAVLSGVIGASIEALVLQKDLTSDPEPETLQQSGTIR